MWSFSGKRVEPARAFAHLRPGRRYHVVKPFIDHDGIAHLNGEMWTFVGSAFLPYEDGLTLDVVWADGLQRTIRLQRRPDAEGPLIDALESHIAEDSPANLRVSLAISVTASVSLMMCTPHTLA